MDEEAKRKLTGEIAWRCIKELKPELAQGLLDLVKEGLTPTEVRKLCQDKGKESLAFCDIVWAATDFLWELTEENNRGVQKIAAKVRGKQGSHFKQNPPAAAKRKKID